MPLLKTLQKKLKVLTSMIYHSQTHFKVCNFSKTGIYDSVHWGVFEQPRVKTETVSMTNKNKGFQILSTLISGHSKTHRTTKYLFWKILIIWNFKVLTSMIHGSFSHANLTANSDFIICIWCSWWSGSSVWRTICSRLWLLFLLFRAGFFLVCIFFQKSFTLGKW